MPGSADAWLVALWEHWKEGRGGRTQPDRAIIMQPDLTISRLTRRGRGRASRRLECGNWVSARARRRRRSPMLRALLGLAALLLLTACSSQPTPQQTQSTH